MTARSLRHPSNEGGNPLRGGVMKLVDEEPMETLHLYVVPEDQMPPKRDYLSIFTIIFCSIFLIGIIVISILAPSPDHEVSFSLTIQGYALAPVSKAIQTNVTATGNQYVPATTATGIITFYNCAIYPQLLPTPQLNPTCSTVSTSSPQVGKETLNAVLRITETCKAFSYRISSVKDAIHTYSRRFGTLTRVQFTIVGIKGVLLMIYVTARS